MCVYLYIYILNRSVRGLDSMNLTGEIEYRGNHAKEEALGGGREQEEGRTYRLGNSRLEELF